jgi:NTE family protein
MADSLTVEGQALQGLGADLVLEGGGVKGIGLAGAAITMHKAGYVFPRVAGTSAGAIVAALVAAYQSPQAAAAGVNLRQLETDMRELDYHRFMETSWAERHLPLIGKAADIVEHQGLYKTDFLAEWLSSKLDPIGIRTFADLKITDDGPTSKQPGTNLLPRQRYRLVTHTADLSRGALVRLPWDLPYYLLKDPDEADVVAQVAAIDAFPVVDAVRASMSIPFFFRPFVQKTAYGACTWVDGGMLQNFPVTVFDRTDGLPSRWPTFGIKLSARPRVNGTDTPVHGDIREALSIAHTALGEWNRYPLADEDVGNRTVYVDTLGVSATDFGLSAQVRELLFENGCTAATSFMANWQRSQAATKPAPQEASLTEVGAQ